MITQHCVKRIEERHINIDLEILEYLCNKASCDTAFILGEINFLGDMNHVILIVRENNAVTIEFRRCSQPHTEKSLNVDMIVEYPCLF